MAGFCFKITCRLGWVAGLLAVLWLTTAAATAQPTELEQVVEVRIVGNVVTPLATIQNQLQTRAGRPFREETVERDVRQLATRGWFVDVRPLYEKVAGGRIVIFQVTERPRLRYVKYLGNEFIKDKILARESELKVGDAVDPYAVEEGRRKIEEYYKEHGYARVQVTILEGGKPSDKGAVYVIHEGEVQRVLSVDFVGNTIASDARLKTQIKSKPGFMYIFKGYVDRTKIDEDIDRLTAYYRSLGFFRARIGREVEFGESGKWASLKFVIDEGPRYQVRNISFLGNKKFATDQLAAGLEMQGGAYFDQAKMTKDVNNLRDLYGSQGHVFADVKADPRFLEEPGVLDLVYDIEEGDRYRVGRINVHIEGENAHTRMQTVLNRVSLRTGDVFDIRELRASERRLKASGLFLNNPQQGQAPRIVFNPPGADDAELAAKGGGFRGQSPDPLPGVLRAATPQPRAIDIFYHEDDAAQPGDTPAPAPPTAPAVYRGQSPDQNAWQAHAPQASVYGSRPMGAVGPSESVRSTIAARPVAQNYLRPAAAQAPTAAPRPVLRSQSPDNGQWQYTAPASGSVYGGRPIGAVSPSAAARPAGAANYGQPAGQQAIYSQPAATSPSDAQQALYQPSVQNEGQSAYAQPAQYAQPGPALPNYNPPVQGGWPNGEPVPLYGGPGPGPEAGAMPGQMPGPIFSPPGQEQLPLINPDVYVEEAQTGRFMLGVGINSDAGVVGQITIDEQNFDWRRWPTSFEDFRNGTAFRGAGQRFRMELMPGDQVQRYLVSFQEPYLLDTAVSLGLSGFFFDRRYTDWDEQRLGGRVSLGYQLTPDLSAAVAYRGESVNIHDPRVPTPPALAEVLGDNSLHGFKLALTHDTRDSAFLPTEGHYVQLSGEQVVGSFVYPRAELEARQYYLVRERPDGSGRHVLSVSGHAGWSGEDTPLYDRFFAGGFSTLRGFRFRGATPRDMGVFVGGDFMLLSSVEYLVPITADDMLRAVAFVDMGTVEEDIEINTWRVAPGVGLRISVPALGPAPIALDFSVPIVKAETDRTQVFSFNIGLLR